MTQKTNLGDREGYGSVKFNVNVAVIDQQTGMRTQIWEKINDVGDVQLVQLLCANLFGAAQSAVKDITGTNRSVAANSAVTAIQIVAGTGGAAAVVTDYKLGAIVPGGQGTQNATVNTVDTTTGAVTLTANMLAPASTITYKEIGVYVTIGGNTFQVARDYNDTGWTVTTMQYLQVTYTITPS